MKPAPFRFKQFTVAHDKCAMKVNTDGVLLGAWADVSNAAYVLDIGTGTGVIALMAAQQNNSAMIQALEIDEPSFKQAADNFQQSKWSNRLTAFHQSFQNFSAPQLYDCIICNPPYFINDMKSPQLSKNVARHSITLTYQELLTHSNRLLSVNGQLFICIPAFNFETIQAEAQAQNLFITHHAQVIAVEGKPPYLSLVCIRRQKLPTENETIIIQTQEGNFTAHYRKLTEAYYL